MSTVSVFFRRGAAPPPKRGQLLPPQTGLGGPVVDGGGGGGLGSGRLLLVLVAPLRDDDVDVRRGFYDARGGGAGGKEGSYLGETFGKLRNQLSKSSCCKDIPILLLKFTF